MEVEAEAEPLEPVVFIEAGDSEWDLKSFRKTPKSFYLAFFCFFLETVAGENRGKCKVCEKWFESSRFEIYSCPATTAGIERMFSIAGHLIDTRTTTMKDGNFEKKLFCNVNQEAMFLGRKGKYMSVWLETWFVRIRSGFRKLWASSFGNFFKSTVFRNSIVGENFQFGAAVVRRFDKRQ